MTFYLALEIIRRFSDPDKSSENTFRIFLKWSYYIQLLKKYIIGDEDIILEMILKHKRYTVMRIWNDEIKRKALSDLYEQSKHELYIDHKSKYVELDDNRFEWLKHARHFSKKFYLLADHYGWSNLLNLLVDFENSN